MEMKEYINFTQKERIKSLIELFLCSQTINNPPNVYTFIKTVCYQDNSFANYYKSIVIAVVSGDNVVIIRYFWKKECLLEMTSIVIPFV